MKTKDYVKKYKLDQNDKFNHAEFTVNLTTDFMTLLEVGKAQNNIKGFDNAVRAIRMKFDAINNKTVGNIPEALWKYFYATVVVKLREELFPELMHKRREEAAQRKQEYEDRQRWTNFYDDLWDRAFFHNIVSKMLRNTIPESSFVALGLSSEASPEDVKSNYRSLSMQHHPDKGGKQDKFIEITEAKNACLAYLSTKVK